MGRNICTKIWQFVSLNINVITLVRSVLRLKLVYCIESSVQVIKNIFAVIQRECILIPTANYFWFSLTD